MRGRIWGCRGSLATPGPETVRYGGNTSCVEVRLQDGTLLVFDAGTGIRKLGLRLAEERVESIHLFLTHLHLDHIEGIGFFSPLYQRGIDLHVWGPRSPVDPLDVRIARLMGPPLFPVQLAEVESMPTYHDADGTIQIGGAQVLVQPVTHQGPTVGYRVTEGGRSLAYIPDHEPALATDLETEAPEWISGLALASGVDVLIHDAQYTEQEYEHYIGWGHSSIRHTVTFAQRAGCRRLVLFHHDPGHDDEMLDAHEARAQQMWTNDGELPCLAYEGMDLILEPVAPS